MVEGRHPKYPAAAEQAEARDLHDHRHRFGHEEASHDGQQQVRSSGQREGGQARSNGQGPRITHEDPSRSGVPPQKTQAAAGHGRRYHRQVEGMGDVVGLGIPELPKGDHGVGAEAEGARPGRQAI